jgi:hypothetical protein
VSWLLLLFSSGPSRANYFHVLLNSSVKITLLLDATKPKLLVMLWNIPGNKCLSEVELSFRTLCQQPDPLYTAFCFFKNGFNIFTVTFPKYFFPWRRKTTYATLSTSCLHYIPPVGNFWCKCLKVLEKIQNYESPRYTDFIVLSFFLSIFLSIFLSSTYVTHTSQHPVLTPSQPITSCWSIPLWMAVTPPYRTLWIS